MDGCELLSPVEREPTPGGAGSRPVPHGRPRCSARRIPGLPIAASASLALVGGVGQAVCSLAGEPDGLRIACSAHGTRSGEHRFCQKDAAV